MGDRLTDVVAVITGGCSGIGEATAVRFVDEGAKVVVADVQDARGEALLERLGPAARYAHVDVTSEAQVAAAVDLAVSEFGRLDAMFNNAGIIGAVGPVTTISAEAFDATIAVLLRGVFFGMKHAARVMQSQPGGGVIVSTSSPAGVVGGLGPHVYSAAKAGVIGLTQSVAAELRPHGIRVNAIIPGAIVTPMTADLVAGDPDAMEQAEKVLADTALLHRPGLPGDIASAAVYLVSSDAAYVTGETLRVDAGMTTAPGASEFATGYPTGEFIREAGGRGAATRSG